MTLISAVSSDRPRTRAQIRTRWVWAIELIGVAAALALVAVVATWIGRPQLRVQAASDDLPRAIDGLGPLEHNEQGTYRWSGAEATLRLFGFEQRAPVIVRARLSARREPGQAPAQVSIAGARPAGPF